MELEHYSNAYSDMKIEEGILVISYKPQLNITLEVAKICVEDRIKFSNGKMYPLVVYMNEMKEISKEAKTYLASDKWMHGVTAGAFIVENHMQRLIGSVFISLYVNMNEVQVPTKLFNTKSAAMAWAKPYRMY